MVWACGKNGSVSYGQNGVDGGSEWSTVQLARKKNPDGLSHPNQNTIIINIIWQSFMKNSKSIMKCN